MRVQTVMPPPLPRKSVGSPVTSRVRAQKSQSPRARREERQQQAGSRQQQQAVFLAVLVLSPSVPRACTILYVHSLRISHPGCLQV